MTSIKKVLGSLWRRAKHFDRHVVSSDPQRAVTSLIVAAAVVFVPVFSAWQVTNTAAGEATPLTTPMSANEPPREPLFSVRRIAQTAATEARVAKVRRNLAAYTAQLPPNSCLLAVADSRNVASVAPDVALAPASNMKLLVAAAALDILGADYRFETRLVGNRAGATIVGDLYLVGGGDPLLTTRAYPPTQRLTTISPTYLDSLADELTASGITLVSGAIVGDESRYDDERYVPTWGDGIRAIEAGPLSAVLVDDGILVGDPFKPTNPAVGAATAFKRLLEARGIRVVGAPRSGTAPTDAVVISRLQSASLSAILVDVLTNSDNNAAELLLKEMGLVSKQSPTRVAGLQAVAEALEARGLSMDGVVLADGSGLDAGNRVTCSTLTSLLESFGFDSPIGQGLALAGTTGTLRDVFTTGPANGRVRAKTGTLRNVKSLSGFFPTRDGSIAFALILNDSGVSNQSEYRPLWNGLMNAFAAYRDEPQTERLQPR